MPYTSHLSASLFRVLEVSSFKISQVVQPRYVNQEFGRVMAATHENRGLATAQWLNDTFKSEASESKTSHTCEKTHGMLQSWSQRLARAEIRTEHRLYVCELPDSATSSSAALVANGSGVDDFEHGACIDRADRHEVDQLDQVYNTDWTPGCSSTTQAWSCRPNHAWQNRCLKRAQTSWNWRCHHDLWLQQESRLPQLIFSRCRIGSASSQGGEKKPSFC